MRVATGLDALIAGGAAALRGRRVGLIANPTAIDFELRHALDVLPSLGVQLSALFGPEHGLRGDAQDMAPVESASAHGSVPVFSLYGHTATSLTPTPEMLSLVDVLVFDIQDVGSRYYTFVWTMVLAMRAAAAAGKAFVVLDRPNPIGGNNIEGPPVDEGFDSFVGLVNCPTRHGMTVGEIAKWRVAEERLDLDLTIVPMSGWSRGMLFGQTGLPWVMPSPNMPTFDTALVYPGMCLVEGTEVSEGRGTTRPFELSGAPYLSPDALARALQHCDGAVARPCVFTPTFHKHAGLACGAIQWHVTNPITFRPVEAGLRFVEASVRLGGAHFAWRQKAYEFVDQIPAFDLLMGSPRPRQAIESGATLGDVCQAWRTFEAAFAEMRRPYLMYS